MNNPEERYYRADSVPVEILRELKAAAARRGIPVKEAFYTLLIPRIGLGPWEFQLCTEILGGQRRVASGEFLEGEVEDFGTHLPVKAKAALTAAAAKLGVQIGAAGRLILIGRAGMIEKCLPLPKKRSPEVEKPEEVLVR